MRENGRHREMVSGSLGPKIDEPFANLLIEWCLVQSLSARLTILQKEHKRGERAYKVKGKAILAYIF